MILHKMNLSQPFLIDGYKFDLRIYTLVTGCDPLRIFVFKDGLARFATTKYVEPTQHNVVGGVGGVGRTGVLQRADIVSKSSVWG